MQRNRKKSCQAFSLTPPRYFILNLFLVFQIFTIHITLFAIMFRLTIHTAKTSAHIFFFFVSPLFKKRLKCYQRVPKKPVYSPFFPMLLLFFAITEKEMKGNCTFISLLLRPQKEFYFFMASSTATATATVMPTIGLLPAPRKPIISTCAGTEELPANCASECMRPMVSVMP